MNQPQPVATGDLNRTPLAGLLTTISGKKHSGSLVVAESEQRLHCVTFRGGLPFKARLADPVDLVGELLVETGDLDGVFLSSVLDAAEATHTLFGQTALEMGLIQPQALTQALVYQTLRRVARLFALFHATYGVYREDFLANFGDADSPQVDTLAIISAGVRASYDEAKLQQVLGKLTQIPVVVTAQEEQLARFRFNEEEDEVVQFLAVPRMLSELALALGLEKELVFRVAHCLHSAGMLEVQTPAASSPPQQPRGAPSGAPRPSPAASSPPSPPQTASPAPAPSSSAAPTPPAQKPAKPRPPEPSPMTDSGEPKSERRLEAEVLIAKGEDATYFELLGVSIDAEGPELQKAYVKRARQFHPDRATGDLAEIRPQMAELFARISVAHQTLKDPAKRKEYLSTLSFKEEFGGASTPSEEGGATAPPVREEEIVERLLTADESFLKAKIMLKRNKLDEAEELARAASRANPDHGEYAALVAWLESRQRPRTESVEDLIMTLKDCVEKAPKAEDVHFYLAELLYKEGQVRKALRHYETVVEINEHNIDAVRMIRLIRLKAQKSKQRQKEKEQQSVGGFLGALFGDGKKK